MSLKDLKYTKHFIRIWKIVLVAKLLKRLVDRANDEGMSRRYWWEFTPYSVYNYSYYPTFLVHWADGKLRICDR